MKISRVQSGLRAKLLHPSRHSKKQDEPFGDVLDDEREQVETFEGHDSAQQAQNDLLRECHFLVQLENPALLVMLAVGCGDGDHRDFGWSCRRRHGHDRRFVLSYSWRIHPPHIATVLYRLKRAQRIYIESTTVGCFASVVTHACQL
ncbi:hypothetical protein PC129_g10443 [Phytophthora cactorum]|uniref:Uncharacterized protein n=1 Tax=Phytophthora cactorum TaxID=29920 RepID=A0A8T1GAM2_9STRA|nr:hypothetical protein PC118_g7735 [Phytophthora cactorum]KAG3218750.1 hypothetical protein PC129_g10443 [Phytophthora cactorum]